MTIKSNRINKFAFIGALVAFGFLSNPSANAISANTELPTGQSVVSGNVNFNQVGSTLNINATTNHSIVNYNTFNIGSAATVNFTLPSSTSSILNRVTSGIPSQLLGTMTSNGQVFLVNPAGIVVGPSANISFTGAGNVFSTLNIQNTDFLNGHYTFARDAGATPASIDIQSGARIYSSGSISFVSSSFSNAGLVFTPYSNLQVGVGDRVTLGDNLVGITVNEGLQQALNQTLISNTGYLQGANVILKATNLHSVIKDMIVNTGSLSALKVIGDQSTGNLEIVAIGGGVNLGGGTLLANNATITSTDTITLPSNIIRPVPGNNDIKYPEGTSLITGSLTTIEIPEGSDLVNQNGGETQKLLDLQKNVSTIYNNKDNIDVRKLLPKWEATIRQQFPIVIHSEN